MRIKLFWHLSIFFLACHLVYAQKPDNRAIWEDEISSFLQEDKESGWENGGVVFVGSSSIRGWHNLKEDFKEYYVLNRGFGGSRIGDALYYFDKIVGKYQPRKIVLYSGENDIASGKSPEKVVDLFKDFYEKCRAELPQSELIFVSMKPSLARWRFYTLMHKANLAIKEFSEANCKVQFVDVSEIMLNEEGKPKPEIFLGDGLHMNPRGYELWRQVLEPYLSK